MGKWSHPFIAILTALVVGVGTHYWFIGSASRNPVTSPAAPSGFEPSWIAATNQARVDLFQAVVISDVGTNKTARLNKFVEARHRISLETLAVAFIMAAFAALVAGGILLWQWQARRWLAVLLPISVATAVWWFFDRTPRQYLHFPVEIIQALSSKAFSSPASPLPSIRWLVLCHGIAFGCALLLCSAAAWIIIQTDVLRKKAQVESPPPTDSPLPAQSRSLLKQLDWILYLGTVVLALCVLFEKGFYDWLASFYLPDKAQHDAFQTMAGSLLVATGLMGSLFIAAYYLPAALAVKSIPGIPEFKLTTKLKNTFAVTGPLLVGGIAKVLEILNSLDG